MTHLPTKAETQALPPEHRHCGRFRVKGVTTNLGRVVDVSGSGMRLQTAGSQSSKKGEVVTLVVNSDHTPSFRVKARVVWGRKIGLFKHQCGLCFEGLDQAAKSGLTSIVAANFSRKAMAA